MSKIKKIFFKYIVFYGVLLVRHEWIWPYIRNFEKTQYYSKVELDDYQLKRLKELIKKSKKSSFYAGANYGMEIEDIADIKNFPIISKDDLRRQSYRLQTRDKGFFDTEKTSGGSTGAPVKVIKPSSGMAKEFAATWRGYSWAGIDIGDLQFRFWGVPLTAKSNFRSKLVDLVARRIRFSAFRFRSSDLEAYLRLMSNSKDYYLYGYASMIYEMASHLLKNEIKLSSPPICVIVTSEVLTLSMRSTIEKSFNCGVFNEYGCGEVGTIAHECDQGALHINAENVILEVVDDHGEAVPEGQVGKLVVTDLNNDVMPLIRYNLEDFGSISQSHCSCGRTLPVLGDLKGRAYDFIENEKGEKFHGEFFLYIAEDIAKRGIRIDGIQFVKTSEKIVVKLVVDEDVFPNISNIIREKMKKEFSNSIPIEIVKTEKIEREKSGKLRVIKRES